jgi:hypothetical protein
MISKITVENNVVNNGVIEDLELPPDPTKVRYTLDDLKIKIANPNLSEIEQQQVRDLLSQNADIFAPKLTDITVTPILQHQINLKPGSIPFKARPYKLSPEGRAEIQRQVEELENLGLVSRSESLWAAPVFLVKKKSVGAEPVEYRMVINYKSLNACTQETRQVLPNIGDVMDVMEVKALACTSLQLMREMAIGQ